MRRNCCSMERIGRASLFVLFFSSRRRHTRYIGDWSSDVCSSDLGLYLVLILITFFYIGILFVYGTPSAKPVLANAIGLVLYGGALLALGMWFSTFTKNQIIAGSIGLAALLLLYVLDWVTEYSNRTPRSVIAYMGFRTRCDSFAKCFLDCT